MAGRQPTRTSLVVVIGFLLAWTMWTWSTFRTDAIADFDTRSLADPLAPQSATAQIAAAFALLTWPGLAYLALAAVAFWAARRRLRNLAVALVLMIILGWGGNQLTKIIIGRTRPQSALDVLTSTGFAYPSGHLTAAVTSVIAVGATFAVTRQSFRARVIWQMSGAGLVIAVGVDRWLLGAHYLSDIIGGALFGALVASLSLLIAGVRVPVPSHLVNEFVRSLEARTDSGEPPRRAAVIYNPSKVTDWITFRRHIEYALKSRGWERALWLETARDDTGRAMTAQAVREKVDLVIGAGGDGTIRVICAGLAGTGIPFGLIPAGTGNLLARNMGIPLDEGSAIDVAFDGVDKPIDLVKITVDNGEPDYSAVMAGIGIDAVIMEGTDPNLKRAVGSAAYFVAAARHANHPALRTTIKINDEPPVKRRAHVIVIGNVGFLQANIPLIPEARADDGLLDVLVASPRTAADWVRITTRLMTRRKSGDEQLDRFTGSKVTIQVEEQDQYQLDGDTVGVCNTMTAEVIPGTLVLRVPKRLSVGGRSSEHPR